LGPQQQQLPQQQFFSAPQAFGSWVQRWEPHAQHQQLQAPQQQPWQQSPNGPAVQQTWPSAHESGFFGQEFPPPAPGN
jgi:hypothetical protein